MPRPVLAVQGGDVVVDLSADDRKPLVSATRC